MKFVFTAQSVEFPYIVAARIVDDSGERYVEVLYHPDAAPAASKAKKLAGNPLLMAFVKSQIGDDASTFGFARVGTAN